MLGGRKKDKGFSSRNKVQQYHSDGTESITMMGKPFRVLQKVSDLPAAYVSTRRRAKHSEEEMSHVYLVENSSRLSEFPRHLAIKRSFFAVDQVADAHKELDIFMRVKDKNIVRVYHSEIVRNEGKLSVSIAMEYCANNLYRRIRSGLGAGAGTRLAESEICHVLLAVTSALGYLHTRQPPITHRDIRPENILINNNQTGPLAYKLCNFSSASTDAYHCENREEASMAIADIERHTNPAFRSPEMADPWSRRRIDEKVDMWSLGVLLYYMMYLKLPFEPTNMALSGNPKVRFPAGSEGRYTGSLRVMVEHLLDPNPESRWDVFALTNFLRFDEDVSRHLGTFCFSKTEWPEGWEEQDVKVLNREPPRKAPAITYNGEAGHERIGDDERAGGGAPTPTATRGASATTGGGATGAKARSDDVVREAMMVLGGADDEDDPEMAQYRAMIILEQEEAWERAKAAAAGGNRGSSQSGGQSPKPAAANASSQQNGNEASKKAEAKVEKKDMFDDLFGGPTAAAAPPQAASASPIGRASQSAQAESPATAPAAAAAAAAQRDIFSTDDLFSAPAPPPSAPQGMNYGMPYQQQQPPGMMMMMGGGGIPNAAIAGGWGSGMPAMHPSPPLPPQQQQSMMNMTGYADPMQKIPPLQGQQQQAPNMMMGGGMSQPPYTSSPQSYMSPQQQQQQQQGSMNFMAPAPGQSGSPVPAAPAAPAAPAQSKKKDPFEDLFA